jgi:general secretion pathway protein F
MPFFQYSATDKTGRQVQGTMQATTADAARLALQNAGLQTHDVRPQQVGQAPPARPKARPVAPPARPQASRPIVATPSVVRTPPGSDKHLYFILTQLSDFFRSGISPAQALQHLSDKAPPLYKQSLSEASIRVAEGMTLSECLARYPDLYPAHVVGAIRAAEAAGFVPDAVMRKSATVLSARKIGVKCVIFILMAGIMVVITPLSLAVINGALDSIRQQDAAGGTLPVGTTIWGAVLQQLKVMAPLALVIAGLIWFGAWGWKQRPMQRLRHRLGLLPPLRKRAESEAMYWLGWSMSMATKAGLTHQAAYTLSVESIPNLILRERAMADAKGIRENEPLSQALARSTMLPREYGDMVRNAEIAGNVSGALERIGDSAEADFIRTDSAASALLMVLLYIPLGLLTLVLATLLISTWYKGLIDWGLGESAMGAAVWAIFG